MLTIGILKEYVRVRTIIYKPLCNQYQYTTGMVVLIFVTTMMPMLLRFVLSISIDNNNNSNNRLLLASVTLYKTLFERKLVTVVIVHAIGRTLFWYSFYVEATIKNKKITALLQK